MGWLDHIGWLVVACALAAAVAGCEDGHDGFTESEWETIRTLSPGPQALALELCPAGFADPGDNCRALADLGQTVFLTKSIAGPIKASNALGQAGQCSKVACQTCHRVDYAFADPNLLGVSVGTGTTKRNAPTMINAAHYRQLTWIGLYDSVQNTFQLPLTAGGVFNSSFARVAAYLNCNPELTARYVAVFGHAPSKDAVVHDVPIAVDAYLRRLAGVHSRFDAWAAGEGELTAAEKRGLKLFINKAGCIECHRGPMFSDATLDFPAGDDPFRGFRATGVPLVGNPDNGLFEHTGRAEDRGKFRTPSLRNVALTAPYMHAGQFASLPEVVDFYNRGAPDHPPGVTIEPQIRPLELTPGETADLVAFLGALTGDASEIEPHWRALADADGGIVVPECKLPDDAGCGP